MERLNKQEGRKNETAREVGSQGLTLFFSCPSLQEGGLSVIDPYLF